MKEKAAVIAGVYKKRREIENCFQDHKTAFPHQGLHGDFLQRRLLSDMVRTGSRHPY
ncbi:MAG: hypothetical protein LBP22_04855 [Deltaproteobacteria bacterium]|jgi:hypothetical protein|nr:hypothetical protein [Deltaproteobacteria bacterium]